MMFFIYDPMWSQPIYHKPDCTCGAKHTSNPNGHSDWCDQVEKPLTEYKGYTVKLLDPPTAIRSGLTTTRTVKADRTILINKSWFDSLTKEQQISVLDHEYTHAEKVVVVGSGGAWSVGGWFIP